MKTNKIYEKDSFTKEYQTSVISCTKSNRKGYENLYEVITNSTIFSPEGGGQKCDRGTFDDIKVIDVQELDGEIIHFLESPVEEKKEIVQRIDFELRFRRMQNHNAEHLICGLIHKKYGYENVGFHLSETYDDEDNLVGIEAIMDVDGPIDAKDLKTIEAEANRAISENVDVFSAFPSAEEAKNIPYRSKMEIEENLRLVVIDGYDICACCAPCLKSSAQMQLVKIIDYMPHRGGMRLTLKAGLDAVNDYVALHDDNKGAMKVLSCVRGECSDAVKKLSDKLTEAHEETVRVKKQITLLLVDELNRNMQSNDSKYILYFTNDLDEVQVRVLINETVANNSKALIVFFEESENGYRFVAGKNEKLSDVSLKELAVKMRESLNARGGGSEQMIQGSVPAAKESINNFFNTLN